MMSSHDVLDRPKHVEGDFIKFGLIYKYRVHSWLMFICVQNEMKCNMHKHKHLEA
jgi:hypothetical protein